MKRCNSCNINYDTDRKSCPFCRDILEEISEPKFQSYPKYKETKTKMKLVEKIFIFLSIVTVIICALSNFYDYKAGNTYLWSVVVFIGIVLLWALIRGIIISNRYFAERFLFVNIYRESWVHTHLLIRFSHHRFDLVNINLCTGIRYHNGIVNMNSGDSLSKQRL